MKAVTLEVMEHEDQVRHQLERHYTEPQRFYHIFSHLLEMFRLLPEPPKERSLYKVS